MDESEFPNIYGLIGKPENDYLEYKAVLIPSKSMAKIISSLANTRGGYLVIGVKETIDNKMEIVGLSQDFHANAVTQKALEYLSSQPCITHKYINYEGKILYIIHVDKSKNQIKFEGQVYIREGAEIRSLNDFKVNDKPSKQSKITFISIKLYKMLPISTASLASLIKHYQSILKLFDDLSNILYPSSLDSASITYEGKTLSRILFSSCVDCFELYLSELLYEIYLSKPDTLKTNETVTLQEVLNCSDMLDFIEYYAKQKIQKLQKGSVKGFIKENKQIAALDAISQDEQNEIEKILQIRHLYSHRNGIVDEKFLQFFPGQYQINTEHVMSIKEICERMEYLIMVSGNVDSAAVKKFNLSIGTV